MTIQDRSKRCAQAGRQYCGTLTGVLRITYGEDFALGCRQIAATESDDNEKAFWLGLADDWEKWESTREHRH
jgi:hypothetical protein